MLILTNDFLNFIEIMNWVFAIEVSIFGCENKVVEEMFRGCLNYEILEYKRILCFKFLFYRFQNHLNSLTNKIYF